MPQSGPNHVDKWLQCRRNSCKNPFQNEESALFIHPLRGDPRPRCTETVTGGAGWSAKLRQFLQMGAGLHAIDHEATKGPTPAHEFPVAGYQDRERLGRHPSLGGTGCVAGKWIQRMSGHQDRASGRPPQLHALPCEVNPACRPLSDPRWRETAVNRSAGVEGDPPAPILYVAFTHTGLVLFPSRSLP